MRPLLIGGLTTVALLGSVSPAGEPVLDFSGPPGSAKPFLTATPSGGLLATWFEPRDSGRFALRIAARRAGRWSAPVTVAERSDFFVNWADFPSAVETADGRWLVHWLQKSASKNYAYHIRISGSADRGKTWSTPVVAHSDSSDTEHGFVAMLPRPEGGADLLWLDGRQNAGAVGHGAMALAAGSIDPAGRVARDQLIDTKTCDCCQTALARTTEGLLAVYRDRTDEEVRDIAVMLERNGRWSKPVPVAVDGWVYRACPVNGPSITATGREVAVAWYTGAQERPRVHLARSSDAGATFSEPLRVDDGRPLGRAELELASDGSALVVWLEQSGDQAEWRVKRIRRDGRIMARWTLGRVPPTREAGFARAALIGRELAVSWTAPGPQGGVRINRITLP